MKELIETLKNFGFTEKQAKVYIAATKLGDSLVSELGKEAGINRVSTYDVLEKLKDRKLISSYTKKRMKYFSAISPIQLHNKLEKHTQELHLLLPKFPQKTQQSSQTNIQVFEEINDLKKIFEQALKFNDELYLIFDPQTLEKFWPSFIKDFEEKRAKKGLFLKTICPENEISFHYEEQDRDLFRSTKIHPEDTTNQSSDSLIFITNSKVVLANLNLSAISITEINDQYLASSHLNLFNHLFNLTPKAKPTTHRPKTALLKAIPEEELKSIDKEDITTDNLTLF